MLCHIQQMVHFFPKTNILFTFFFNLNKDTFAFSFTNNILKFNNIWMDVGGIANEGQLDLCKNLQQMVLKMETFYIMELFPLNTSFLVCNLCLHGNQCCNSCSHACFINLLQYLVWMSKTNLFGLIW
jgi:hypothetical protein